MSIPSSNLINEEETHLFLCFCTFVMNIRGKKLSIQNVFVQTLQDEKYKNIMKEILSLDSDFDLVKVFLEFDPTIAKSKYVTKYINSVNGKTKKAKKTKKKKK